MSWRALLALALLSAWAGARPAQSEPSSFEELARLLAQQRFSAALERAEAMASTLERERGRLHVLWSAGDLAGAYRAARAGLLASAEDAWLLERATALALALGAAEAAAEHLGRLEAVLAQLAPQERTGYAAAAADHDRELRPMLAKLRARRNGVRRARWVLFSAGAIVGAIWWLAGRAGAP